MRIFVISILLALVMPQMVQSQEKVRIKGRIEGLADSTWITLVNANQPEEILDSAMVLRSKFRLKANIKEPMLASLQLGEGRSYMTFIDQSSSRIKGKLDKLDALKWKGSASVRDFAAFKQSFDPLFEKVVGINQQVRGGGWTDSLQEQMQHYQDTIQQAIDRFIAKRRSSPVSAFLLAATYQLKDDVALANQRYSSLTAKAVNNLYGKYLKETIDNELATAVGSVALDFTQEDTAGIPVSLSSFRGQYVLLDFWASWCGPCRVENPNVVANFQKFKSKNFTVLGVSLDRPGQKEKWMKAIYDDQLAWTHVSDLQFWNNEVAQQYKVQSIPQNFLIGPDGKILAKNLRGANLEAKLCELLGCE